MCGELSRYHEHCWCLAMEVGESAPLPVVNRELEQAWKQATRGGGSQAEVTRKWKNYLDRRSRILQFQLRFPDIPGVEVPKYRGKQVTEAVLRSGERIQLPLPDLHQMPGHVSYGWTTAPPWGRRRPSKRRREPGDYSLDKRFGHQVGNQVGKTPFLDEWTGQQIVDAIRDVLEQGEVTVKPAKQEVINDRSGNEWKPAFDYKVKVEGTIRGELIQVKYDVVDGVGVDPYGFPIRSE